MTLPQFHSSVTALSWVGLNDRRRNDGLLAVGMESGLIELWNLSFSRTNLGASLALRMDPLMCHVSSVNRLAWRNKREDEKSLQLASCGADHCVRVFEVTIG